MESKAKLFGHPIHLMLIPLPVGLLSASVVFDDGAHVDAPNSLSGRPASDRSTTA